MKDYLIHSKKHTGSIALWWGPDRCGYTNDIDYAGRYTHEEALEICKPGNYQDSIPVHIEVVHSRLRSRTIVDLGDDGNRKVIDDLPHNLIGEQP